MRTTIVCLALVCVSGCAAETTECCLARAIVPAATPPPRPPPPPPAESPPPTDLTALPASRVLILQSSHIDRLSEVVGVVDVHSEMGGQDAAVEMLKMRAAQLGADAVLGVEFHHGHGEDEPTHLSGLAIRFIDRVQ